MMMNRTLLKRIFPQILACAGLMILCGAAALAQDQGPATAEAAAPAQAVDQRTDGQIEMDVVHALDASQALKNDLITAATIQGEVTLSGTVSSDASKQLAESIAAHVNGVTKVHNNLKVGNPAADAQASQPAPDMQEMPDPDQSQAQQQMAGLPPPGPGPDQGQNPTPNESQAPAQAPYPQQQGAYPQPPPQRPQYQNPRYSQ